MLEERRNKGQLEEMLSIKSVTSGDHMQVLRILYSQTNKK